MKTKEQGCKSSADITITIKGSRNLGPSSTKPDPSRREWGPALFLNLILASILTDAGFLSILTFTSTRTLLQHLDSVLGRMYSIGNRLGLVWGRGWRLGYENSL
ncbi:hypothetical protein IE53DRAFT_390960, partial [Violaceomyces palustris]